MSYDGKHLKINLNSRGDISRAIKALSLNSSSNNLQGNVEKFVEKMVEKGVDIAKSYCPVESGDLKGSIKGKVEKDTSKIVGKISVGTDHAAFVEFGTGVVGQGTYPNVAQTVYAYDVNGHGEEGWNYFDETRQQYFHTKGHVANPFMYKTARDLRGYANDIAQEVLNDSKH